MIRSRIRSLIREVRIWWFSRKLERLRAARKASFEVQDFSKRRAAALKFTRREA